MIQQFHFWVCTWKKQNQHCMFIVTLLTIAKTERQRKCPPQDDWIKKTQEILTVEYCSAIRRKSCHLWQHRWIWRALCYKEARETKTFFGRILRVFYVCIRSYHLQRQSNFFLSDVDAFYFFSCQITLARMPSTMLTRSREWGLLSHSWS